MKIPDMQSAYPVFACLRMQDWQEDGVTKSPENKMEYFVLKLKIDKNRINSVQNRTYFLEKTKKYDIIKLTICI